jgi:hypothetical protein
LQKESGLPNAQVRNFDDDCFDGLLIYLLDLLKGARDRSTALVVGTTADESSKDRDQVRVLCLGLGSPSTSKNARIQLAFLLEACKNLNIVCISVFLLPVSPNAML